MKQTNIQIAQSAWGGSMPDWIAMLANQCDRTTQTGVARSLGVSSAMVNQALRGAYKGDMSKLETRVRGEFMDATVQCPVLDGISTRECLDHQRRPFSNTNHLHVQLFRACRSCPNYVGKDKS